MPVSFSGYLTCPFSGRDNVSPDSTTADSSGAEPAIAHTPQTNIEQPMEVSTLLFDFEIEL